MILSPSSHGSDRARPTRLGSVAFAGKATLLRLSRLIRDTARALPRLSKAGGEDLVHVRGESLTPLWSDPSPAERQAQLGKVQNLRVACRALDGLVLPAGHTFSFWRQVGAPLAWRGFARGRMLREGCIVASVGGGLCQLSNALYEAALQSGCRIVERHPHSQIVPGSAAVAGRDATVAWNYVDLRFAPAEKMRLTTRMDRDRLIVRLLAEQQAVAGFGLPIGPALDASSEPDTGAPRSCGSCAQTDCHLHETDGKRPPPVQAFIVDEAWPEFRDHVAAVRTDGDRLAHPLALGRLTPTRLAWNRAGFAKAWSASPAALWRAIALRSSRSGAGARRAELEGAGRIARALARRLTPEVTALTVAQSYLPFLWRDGHLGGREITVLMTRAPMAELQARLDRNAEAQPERRSLSDFRAPPWMVAAETASLAQASRLVTPHAALAAQLGERVVRLPWDRPAVQPLVPHRPAGRIAFPGPTVARKGAHLVRAAAQELGLTVVPMGAELEGPGFWDGVATAPFDGWSSVDAVVQPALVEHQPRRLLLALALGLPVIATEACGLEPQPGLTLIPADGAGALVEALRCVLNAALPRAVFSKTGRNGSHQTAAPVARGSTRGG